MDAAGAARTQISVNRSMARLGVSFLTDFSGEAGS